MVILLPRSVGRGRTNRVAPLHFSWAKTKQRINSPSQQISLAGLWIMGIPWHFITPTSMTGNSLYCKSLHKPVLHFWELQSRAFSCEKSTILSRHAMQVQHHLRFRYYPASGSHSHICSLQASRSLRLCLWPGLCPSNQELMQLKISAAIVDPFLSYSCAEKQTAPAVWPGASTPVPDQ